MEKCPYCDHEITEYWDYPKIFIEDVKRLDIPETIMSVYSGDMILPYEFKLNWLFKKERVKNPEFFDVYNNHKDKTKPIVLNGQAYELIIPPNTPLEQDPDDPQIKASYFKRKDLTSLANEAINSRLVQQRLSKLVSFIGKEIDKKELLSLEDFRSEDLETTFSFPQTFFSEGDHESKNLYFLVSGGTDEDCWGCIRLAYVVYQGRFNLQK